MVSLFSSGSRSQRGSEICEDKNPRIRGKDHRFPSLSLFAVKNLLRSTLRRPAQNMKSQLITIPVVLLLSGLVSGSSLPDTYSLVDTVIGEDFYSAFEWQAMPDPTNGRVYVNQIIYQFFWPYTYSRRNYVDKETSKSAGLTSATSDSFILRADHTAVLGPSGPGRDSVRIRSLKRYAQHIAV